MATRATLTPYSAEFPSANYPDLTVSNRRPILAYDAATNESAQWTLVAPAGLTGTLTLICNCIMATATSGNVVVQGLVEAVTPADSLNLGTTDSFDTANSTTQAVAGTAGHLFTVSITLTNKDSIAAADYVRLRVLRDAANASDTATGDMHLLAVEWRDAA